MKSSKLKWYVINKEYVNYLKCFDDKVENIDYNLNIKPYIGILLSLNKFNYYVPISSVKEKHYKMKDKIDFVKLIHKNKILGVLNLNNMIPVLEKDITYLRYEEIGQYRTFKNEKEKELYIALLSLELSIMNKKIEKIKGNAYKLYYEKVNNPMSKVSMRCCDFKVLEEKCKIWRNN